MRSARAAGWSAARSRKRLQLLQGRVDREAAIVHGQPVDDAIGVDADGLLLLRGRFIPTPHLSRRSEEGEAQAIDRTAGEQRRNLRIFGGGLAEAGEGGPDLDRALVVGAVENSRQESDIPSPQMAQQSEGMRGGEQGSLRQSERLSRGLFEADDARLAGRGDLGLALEGGGDGIAVEVAHEEAVVLAVLGFPGTQAPADLARAAVVIEELDSGLLARRPAVAGIGEL